MGNYWADYDFICGLIGVNFYTDDKCRIPYIPLPWTFFEVNKCQKPEPQLGLPSLKFDVTCFEGVDYDTKN